MQISVSSICSSLSQFTTDLVLTLPGFFHRQSCSFPTLLLVSFALHGERKWNLQARCFRFLSRWQVRCIWLLLRVPLWWQAHMYFLPSYLPLGLQVGWDGTKYEIWKVMIKSILESYDLIFWNVPPPNPNDEELYTMGCRCATQQVAIWDRSNARVKSFIFLNCMRRVINHEKRTTVAHDIWQHLAFLYDGFMPMTRVALEL